VTTHQVQAIIIMISAAALAALIDLSGWIAGRWRQRKGAGDGRELTVVESDTAGDSPT
jgi:hypothetical protein